MKKRPWQQKNEQDEIMDYEQEELLPMEAIERKPMVEKDRSYGFYWYEILWKFLRPLMILLISLIVTLGVVMTGIDMVNQRFFYTQQESTEVPFEVKPKDSVAKTAQRLEDMGLIKNKTIFKMYVEFMGEGHKLQAGNYTLKRDMDFAEILSRITAGDGNPTVRNITIVPGWKVERIAEYLLKEKVISDTALFLSLCKTGENYADYSSIEAVRALGSSNTRKYTLEGYLAPDTYEIFITAKEDDIIKKLLTQTDMVFGATNFERADELNMTLHQVLTLASIIQKEANNEDFKKVSAVFHNRLNNNMRLESCATVQYVLGINKLALGDEETSVSSPYNTYQNAGLPSGPICSPSKAAIEAALFPDEDFMAEGYLYFCSEDPETGKLFFSKTLAEHQAASELYRPLWIAMDKKGGIQ